MSELSPFFERMNAEVREIEALLSIARDSDLQRRAVGRISDLYSDLAQAKRSAVEAQDEDQANAILGYECAFSTLQNELLTWIFLKQEEPEKAWDCLVSAQEAATWASRAHRGFRHLEEHLLRLEALEQLVFPPQVFASLGAIVERQLCSICEADYELCSHIAGRPYWGEFCNARQEKLKLDHVAIVETPADKRCRVTHFNVADGRRNRMTWKVEAPDPDAKDVRIA